MECLQTVSYLICINGWPAEPFDAKRGLQQVDPMCPFFFVLAMEYLPRKLKQSITMLEFKFHPRYAKMNVIQLGFANDLLLSCKGDVKSVQLLYDCFHHFSQASGLIANLDKSCVYFGGVKDIIQTAMCLAFQVFRSTLKYQKIINNAMLDLDHKDIGRILCWTTKFLSYAGRETLIKAVLFSIQVYWSQIFILPSKVIKLIEQTCMRFLWTGGVEKRLCNHGTK